MQNQGSGIIPAGTRVPFEVLYLQYSKGGVYTTDQILLMGKFPRVFARLLYVAFSFLIFTVILSLLSNTSFAQENSTSTAVSIKQNRDEYFLAKVISVKDRSVTESKSTSELVVELTLLEGKEKGKKITASYGIQSTLQENAKLEAGETVVVTKSKGPSGSFYIISDRFRLHSLYIMFGIFFAFVIFFGRLKGLTSIVGLLFSIFVIMLYIVPSIISGQNPLMVALFGAFAIAVGSIYIAHGFLRRTHIALVSTLITLILAAGFSLLFVFLAKLSGGASEEVVFLQSGPLKNLDFHGILLAGIILGALGVLDDITTAQSSAVEQISIADPGLSTAQLYYRGLLIGKEHIASLVNTLVLAYIGASFPLLLLFSTTAQLPLWIVANNEVIMEEVARALVGSIALVFAVPITTILAAYYLRVKEKGKKV